MTTHAATQGWNNQLLQPSPKPDQYGPNFQRPQPEQPIRPYTTAFELEVIHRLDRIQHWINGQIASDAHLDAVINAADRHAKKQKGKRK